MRNYILRQYTTLSSHTTVLGHNGSCHTRNFFQTLAWILWLWLLYMIANYTLPLLLPTIKRIIWWLWIILYIRFIIEFLNKYLDCLIISPQGVVLFEREWLLRYTMQQFDRDTVESISHSQHSLTDKILNKWSLQLTIEHGIVIHFDNISSPHRAANLLRNHKQQHWSPSSNNHTDDVMGLWWASNEKFEILVETLWEVIKDYMWKNKELPQKEKRDM